MVEPLKLAPRHYLRSTQAKLDLKGISLREGNIVMEDVQTGERLRTSEELEAENEDLRARLAA